MFDDFFLRGLIGGIGVAILAGPLGCFVVWQRMSYFGAAIAHAALLGVALGFVLEVDPLVGVLLVSVLFAGGIAVLQSRTILASDTILGIFAHISLALGIVAIGFMETLRVDLMGYLFGDILAVSRADLIWIYGGGSAALLAMMLIWRSLLASVVHAEMAAAEGIAIERTRLLFTLLLATVIALAMKIVGILLIVSLLIIPAAAARPFARSPEQMALWAAIFGVVSVVTGLGASLQIDSASGPSIVIAAFVLFLLARAAVWLKDSLVRRTMSN